MTAAVVAKLLEEMEEYFSHFDHFPLYLLGWTLNGERVSLEQRHDLAQQAFDEFTAGHPSKVVWVPWPLVLEQARPLEPGTPLAFDLDPEGSGDALLQVLVPD